jgi:hypothetical protein
MTVRKFTEFQSQSLEIRNSALLKNALAAPKIGRQLFRIPLSHKARDATLLRLCSYLSVGVLVGEPRYLASAACSRGRSLVCRCGCEEYES